MLTVQETQAKPEETHLRLTNFIKANKGLTFLVVGWVMGVAMVGFTIQQTDKTISRLETQLDRTIEISFKASEHSKEIITSLREENKKLKSKTSTYKIIKPDGTVEEKTVSETESEETVSESVKSEYEKKLAQELLKKEREISKRVSEEIKQTKNLVGAVGINTGGFYYGSISYTVLPPIVLHGYGTQDGEFGIGIGIRL